MFHGVPDSGRDTDIFEEPCHMSCAGFIFPADEVRKPTNQQGISIIFDRNQIKEEEKAFKSETSPDNKRSAEDTGAHVADQSIEWPQVRQMLMKKSLSQPCSDSKLKQGPVQMLCPQVQLRKVDG